MLLARHLESLPGHVAKYAGTLNVFGLVELVDFLTIYRAFQKGIRKRFGESVQLRPVTEIGPRCGRFHVHYAMTSDGVEVTKGDVSEVWRDACGNRRIQVDHKPIEDVSTWSLYMFKAEWKYYEPGNPDCVVLFAKGSPRLPQANRDFLPAKVKAALWDEWIAERHPESASAVVEINPGTAVPPRNNHTANVRINMGKSRVKNRASGPYFERRLCVQAIGLTTNVEINIIKSSVFNRVTGQFRAAFMRLSHRNHGAVGHSRRYRGDIRAHRQSRPVSHRHHGEVRSIDLMPESRPEARPGRQARAP